MNSGRRWERAELDVASGWFRWIRRSFEDDEGEFVFCATMKVLWLISWDGSGFRLFGTLRRRVEPGSLENEPPLKARVQTM